MYHVGFNASKIRPLKLVQFSVLLKTYSESVYFQKLHIFQRYALYSQSFLVIADQIIKL